MNNIDSMQGAYCKALIDGAAEFIEEMYDWPMAEIKQYINDNSSNDFLYIKFTWQELGLTPEWYLKESRSLDNDKLLIRREIDLVWTKSSDNSVYDEESLELIFEKLRKPIGTLALSIKTEEFDIDKGSIKQKYIVKIYKELLADKMYFIGVDTAGGLGRDFSTFVIVDPDDMKPIATFKNNKINTSYFSSLLLELIVEYLPKSILFIENNNYGKGVIDNLIRRIPKSIFYDYKVPDKDKTKVSIFSRQNKNITYGIATTTKTRDLFFDLLNEVVAEDYESLAIDEIYDELKTLVFNKKGKIEHDVNAHDDTLFAYLMVLYSVAYSNNVARLLRDKKAIANKVAVAVSKPNTVSDSPNKDIDGVFKKDIDVDLQKFINMSLESGLDANEIINRMKNEVGSNGVKANKNILDIFGNINKRKVN